MTRRLLLAGTLLTVGAAAGADFETHWRDGQAEVSGYRLTVNRYGQERRGYAVAIYVTEPFSETRRVKSEPPGADSVEALKLNLIRRFQTGIYDYHTMVSVFVRARDFSPLKTTFSSAEWCGHVFEELLFFPREVTGQYHSYFDGESGTVKLDWPAGGVTEDSLWILLRGLRGEFLAPGEARTVPFLPGAYYQRLTHRPPGWTRADISRSRLDPTLYTVRIADGRTGQFWIEPTYPHRIRRWELAPDVRAELTGSIRLPYWQQNRNGDEALLQKLGIRPTLE